MGDTKGERRLVICQCVKAEKSENRYIGVYVVQVF